MMILQDKQRIKEAAVVAIVRGSFSTDDILRIAEVFIDNEINVFEITLNSPSALESISQLQKRFADVALIGAGTVRTVSDWQRAFDAGARFTVAPNYANEVVRMALDKDILHLPGVATPSEVVDAFNAGCTMQKLFPAQALGGIDYLKAIRAPLDDVEFVAVGGVNLDNMLDYLQAGAVAVGIGSSLIPSSGWNTEQIAQQCQLARDVVKKSRHS